MPSLDELSQKKQTHRIILYGSPGSGKTWAIGRLAETHRIIYFSLENGHQTLLNPKCVAPEFRKNIHIIQMMDSPETPIASTSLDTFLKLRKGEFCEMHGRFECPLCKKTKSPFYAIDLNSLNELDIIVIDSLTQWAESIKFHLSKDSPDAKGSYEYWRLLGLYLSRSLSRIQLISNFSVIVISHEQDTESVSGNDKITPAGGTKNFARSNARFFDGSYYLYRENKKHKMQSSSTFSNIFDTKDRSAFDTSRFSDPRDALFYLFNPEKIPPEGNKK